ncbi:MAG: acetate/propionate family kinase [Pirellulales bacterium]|nr:acetate/propionate family kinase [Pirellulales bacterium]
MKILVANLGSTSFKFCVFDMRTEVELARGGTERIGHEKSRSTINVGDWANDEQTPVRGHAGAMSWAFDQLTHKSHGCLKTTGEITAVGFKAVHGGRLTGVQLVTDNVLDAMDEMATVAPAHNPSYVAAMRLLREWFPTTPLVAAFETDFHRSIPNRNRTYAIDPKLATACHIARHGFHGASHRYLAQRMAKLLDRDDARIVSLHLGGSSSLCAIRNGQSVATSMGMSPQCGLPQGTRIGDFDAFALPLLMRVTGESLEATLATLASHGGLLGISGLSADMRDLQDAAAQGNERAQLAIDVYVAAVRHYLGAYLVELGGADAIAFTGGIGERSDSIRSAVCANLSFCGLVLDEDRNSSASGESPIHALESQTQIWVTPTNEELIVARQTKDLLEKR